MGLQPGVFRPQRWRRQGLNAPRVEALFPSPPIFRWAGYFLARTCSTSLDLEVPQRSKFIRCLWRNESFNRARSCVLNESNYDGQSSENHQSPESRSELEGQAEGSPKARSAQEGKEGRSSARTCLSQERKSTRLNYSH